jgi:hypothetical protein
MLSRRATNPPTWETGDKVLVHLSKVKNEEVRRLAGRECVHRGHLRLALEWGTVGASPDTRHKLLYAVDYITITSEVSAV